MFSFLDHLCACFGAAFLVAAQISGTLIMALYFLLSSGTSWRNSFFILFHSCFLFGSSCHSVFWHLHSLLFLGDEGQSLSVMSAAPPATPFIGSQQAFKWGKSIPWCMPSRAPTVTQILPKETPQCLEETEVGRPPFCLFF